MLMCAAVHAAEGRVEMSTPFNAYLYMSFTIIEIRVWPTNWLFAPVCLHHAARTLVHRRPDMRYSLITISFLFFPSFFSLSLSTIELVPFRRTFIDYVIRGNRNYDYDSVHFFLFYYYFFFFLFCCRLKKRGDERDYKLNCGEQFFFIACYFGIERRNLFDS